MLSPQISQSGEAASLSRASLPPRVKKQLEETKKRDEGHAALMAAVLKRKALMESVDGKELTEDIDNKVNRSKKIQRMYAGDPNAKKEIRSPVQPVPFGLFGSTNGAVSFSQTDGKSHGEDVSSNGNVL